MEQRDVKEEIDEEHKSKKDEEEKHAMYKLLQDTKLTRKKTMR